jgi:hypothetical protein
MLREFTVTVEEDVYEAIRPLVENKTIGDFISRVIWQSPAYMANRDPMELPVEERRRRAEAGNSPRRHLSAEEAAERGLGFGDGPRMSPHEAIEMACGIAKDCAFSSESLFEERRKDRDMDEARYRRLFHKDGDGD